MIPRIELIINIVKFIPEILWLSIFTNIEVDLVLPVLSIAVAEILCQPFEY